MIQRTALAAIFGYGLGGYVAYRFMPRRSYHSYSEGAQDSMDKDILGAFEQKYVNLQLNATGFGTNTLTLGRDAHYKNGFTQKPY